MRFCQFAITLITIPVLLSGCASHIKEGMLRLEPIAKPSPIKLCSSKLVQKSETGIAEKQSTVQPVIGKCEFTKFAWADLTVINLSGVQTSSSVDANNELELILNPPAPVNANIEDVLPTNTQDCSTQDCASQTDPLVSGLLVHFDSDQDKPIAKDLEIIKKAAKAALANGLSITVIGHTDSTASEKHNIALSLRRANTIQKMLIQEGISPEKILAAGVAATAPLDTNETEEGRATNRRVHIKYKPDQQKENKQ